ncbi:hypothetical protein FRC09_016072 [Ceratobasidium sp. 395]|nr:hypothetical protein FRC09_016072 [Ceratobasidium sp. 395]
MPADDPADQNAARVIESSLRDAVNRLERPPVELEWFLTLPKRVRRSAQLIRAAQTECQVLLEHVRSEWTRARDIQRQREERLARTKSQPRDLECLRAPDPAAWNGLGRKKTRGRAFEAIGRAYNTRRQLTQPIAATNTAPAARPTPSDDPADAFLLHPSSCHVPKRPLTPPGLREAMYNVPRLLGQANGTDGCDYGCPTPREPTPPPSPPPPVLVPPPDFPRCPKPGEFRVRGVDIHPDMAYIVAQGRHARCAQPGYSAQKAAVDVQRVGVDFPGALEYLAELLFPAGVEKYSKMVNSARMEPLVDFVHGWYNLSKRAQAVQR